MDSNSNFYVFPVVSTPIFNVIAPASGRAASRMQLSMAKDVAKKVSALTAPPGRQGGIISAL